MTYCTRNVMIANEMNEWVIKFNSHSGDGGQWGPYSPYKTKYMFGSKTECELYFEGKLLARVNDYKYLGNIISETTNISGDIFANDYSYSCWKLDVLHMPWNVNWTNRGSCSPELPNIYFYCNYWTHPNYGTEVWGVRTKFTEKMDKLCLWYLKSTMGANPSTSNHIMWVKLGIMPPSVKSQVFVVVTEFVVCLMIC